MGPMSDTAASFLPSLEDATDTQNILGASTLVQVFPESALVMMNPGSEFTATSFLPSLEDAILSHCASGNGMWALRQVFPELVLLRSILGPDRESATSLLPSLEDATELNVMS